VQAITHLPIKFSSSKLHLCIKTNVQVIFLTHATIITQAAMSSIFHETTTSPSENDSNCTLATEPTKPYKVLRTELFRPQEAPIIEKICATLDEAKEMLAESLNTWRLAPPKGRRTIVVPDVGMSFEVFEVGSELRVLVQTDWIEEVVKGETDEKQWMLKEG
jgi:hypothetical protein